MPSLKDKETAVPRSPNGSLKEASIAALGERLGTVDHMVSTASARVRGRIADLDRDAVRLSFDTKVTGPLMLAKHLAPRMNDGGEPLT